MSSLVDIAGFKAHAGLNADEHTDDQALQLLLDAAERSCVLYLDRPPEQVLTPADEVIVTHAIIVWATALLEGRAGEIDMPPAVVALLRPLRSFAR